MLRILAKTIVLVVLVFASVAAAAEQVNVAMRGVGMGELPIIVAMRNRYFATEGLQIRLIQIQSRIAIKSLMAGELDFDLGWNNSIRAAISGTPIKLVAVTVARPLHVLIGRPDIGSGKNLKGKTLGVDAFFPGTDYLSRLTLRYLGVDPEKDVNIVEIDKSVSGLEELREGKIQAAVVDLATAIRAEEEGFKRLIHLGALIDLPVCGIAVTAKKLGLERAQVKKFIRAVHRGARFIKQNRSDTLHILQHFLKMTQSQAARAHEAAVGAYTDDGFISDRALALSVRRVRDELESSGDPMLAQVADWSVLRELLADRRKIPFWLRQYDP
jgi:ABC-type nitrate/sulfonate/bicarbonate transport system substrate-binding protein